MDKKVSLFFRKYFWGREALLFWCGGIWTVMWVITMHRVAHGHSDADPDGWATAFFVGAIAFALGVKGTRRHYNGEDRFFGEIWAVILVMNTVLILFEHYANIPILCGGAKKIPEHLVASAIGTMALFGAVKKLEIGAIIQKILAHFGISSKV